jgi:predicted transcriptional regulator
MRVLLSHIRKNRGITIEELSYKTETPYRQTFQTCSRMESEGIISTDLLQRCSIIDKKH